MVRQAQMDVPSDQTFADFQIGRNHFPRVRACIHVRIFILYAGKCRHYRRRLAPAAEIRSNNRRSGD